MKVIYLKNREEYQEFVKQVDGKTEYTWAQGHQLSDFNPYDDDDDVSKDAEIVILVIPDFMGSTDFQYDELSGFEDNAHFFLGYDINDLDKTSSLETRIKNFLKGL